MRRKAPRRRSSETARRGSFPRGTGIPPSLGCFFSSRRRHTRFHCDWSSDVCSSDLSIQTRADLEVELVAAEPLIVDPVAIDWGPDGKLWVVEMRDYPSGMDGHWKPGSRKIGRASCRERV